MESRSTSLLVALMIVVLMAGTVLIAEDVTGPKPGEGANSSTSLAGLDSAQQLSCRTAPVVLIRV